MYTVIDPNETLPPGVLGDPVVLKSVAGFLNVGAVPVRYLSSEVVDEVNAIASYRVGEGDAERLIQYAYTRLRLDEWLDRQPRRQRYAVLPEAGLTEEIALAAFDSCFRGLVPLTGLTVELASDSATYYPDPQSPAFYGTVTLFFVQADSINLYIPSLSYQKNIVSS